MLHRVLLRLSLFFAFVLAIAFTTGQIVVRYYKDDILHSVIHRFLPHEHVTWGRIEIHATSLTVHNVHVILANKTQIQAGKVLISFDIFHPFSRESDSEKRLLLFLKNVEINDLDIHLVPPSEITPPSTRILDEIVETLEAIDRPPLKIHHFTIQGRIILPSTQSLSPITYAIQGHYDYDQGHMNYTLDEDEGPSSHTPPKPVLPIYGALSWQQDKSMTLTVLNAHNMGLRLHAPLSSFKKIPWTLDWIIHDTRHPCATGEVTLSGHTVTLNHLRAHLSLNPKSPVMLHTDQPVAFDIHPFQIRSPHLNLTLTTHALAPLYPPITLSVHQVPNHPFAYDINIPSISFEHLAHLYDCMSAHQSILDQKKPAPVPAISIPIQGSVSAKASLSWQDENPKAHLLLKTSPLSMPDTDLHIDPITLNADYEHAKAHVKTRLTLTLPKTLEIPDLHPVVDIEGTLDASLPNAPPFLDIKLKNQLQLEPETLSHLLSDEAYGHIRTEISLKGPLNALNLMGNITLDKGGYGHHAIGTFVKSIQARGTMTGNKLIFTAHASDGVSGSVQGEGSLTCPLPDCLKTRMLSYTPVEALSAHITLHLSNFFIGQSDIFSGRAETGTLHLDLPNSKIYGHAILDKATVNLDPIASATSPKIELLNIPNYLEDEDRRDAPTPFHFDLSVTTSNPIKVQGFGIQSTWKGALNLTGNQPDFMGAFDLDKGTLDLTGQPFTFSKGHIQLDGKIKQPILDLEVKRKIDTYDVFIKVQGRPNKATFLFSSVPALSHEEVLSLIVLGRKSDASSITQLLELSNSLSNLSSSGQNPNVFTKFRNALGIDALELKQSDTDTNSQSPQALSIRKYIKSDVSLVFEQTFQASSSEDRHTQATLEKKIGDNWSVDVDLASNGNAGVGLVWRKRY